MEKQEPLYIQITKDIRKKIKSGEWQEGDKIPTEHELCDIYHVSRITIRKALDQLIQENLIVRKKPIGTFVARKEELEDSKNYTIVKGFTEEMLELGIKISTIKVNVIVTRADHSVASYLHISPGDKVIKLKRLRGIENKPIGYFITYFRFDEKFSLNINDYKDSFYEYLATLNIQVKNDREIVEAILPTKEIARVLKRSSTIPVLKRTRFTFDTASNFYEYTECYYISSEYKYFIDFS